MCLRKTLEQMEPQLHAIQWFVCCKPIEVVAVAVAEANVRAVLSSLARGFRSHMYMDCGSWRRTVNPRRV